MNDEVVLPVGAVSGRKTGGYLTRWIMTYPVRKCQVKMRDNVQDDDEDEGHRPLICAKTAPARDCPPQPRLLFMRYTKGQRSFKPKPSLESNETRTVGILLAIHIPPAFWRGAVTRCRQHHGFRGGSPREGDPRVQITGRS